MPAKPPPLTLAAVYFSGVDWSVPTNVIMSAVILKGLFYQAKSEGMVATSTDERAGWKWIRGTLVGLAFVHSYVVTLLGLQDLGGSNMYSNLRMQVPSVPSASPNFLTQRRVLCMLFVGTTNVETCLL